MNRKPVDMLNYFAGTSATTELRDYPLVNQQVQEFAEICAALAPDLPELRDLRPTELSDTFSHWLAEKGLTAKAPTVRYLKISRQGVEIVPTTAVNC